jgi:hypothetical protein
MLISNFNASTKIVHLLFFNFVKNRIMAKGINYTPTEENRKFLELLQNSFKDKGKFKGLSQIINKIVTDVRLANTKNPFR